MTLGRQPYAEPARRLAFFEEWEARLRRIPGVVEVALSDSLPPMGNMMGAMMYGAIDVEGRPRAADSTGGMVASRSVTPACFAALGVPILPGLPRRRPRPQPERRHPQRRAGPAHVPGRESARQANPPGRTGPWRTVVGVAANVKNTVLRERDDPEFYSVRKHTPENVGRSATAIVLRAIDPQALAGAVRAEVAALDPTFR